MSADSRQCLAGIDEAGYGPLLGPLVTGLAAFRVTQRERSLWSQLAAAVTDEVPEDGDLRVAVADSKVLYRGGDGLADVELAVLAFSALEHGAPPSCAREFVERHAGDLACHADDYPWYAEGLAALELPRATTPARVLSAAAALADAAADAGIDRPMFRVRPLLEGAFNDLVDRYGSKARALFDQNAALLSDLLRSVPDPCRVLCDRHGGRMHYGELLAGALPMARIAIVVETPERSTYRVDAGGRTIEFDYRVGAERHGLEVALASLFAKYTRELYVELLNRHFARRVSGIRRTAGYWTDGQRFLRDLEDARAISTEERALLVRRR